MRLCTLLRSISLPLSSLFLTLQLSACGIISSGTEVPGVEDRQLEQAEVFLSRASITMTEFEQYKLTGPTLYKECGQIQRGRFAPSKQEFLGPKEEKLENLRVLAWDVYSAFVENPPQVDQPGTNKHFADPGQLTLRLRFEGKTVEIRTSLDFVTSPTSKTVTSIQKFVSQLREAGGLPFCSNRDFYGISSRAFATAQP